MKMRYISLILFLLVVTSCSSQYDHVPADQFTGTWELSGRKMFNGIQISIIREEGKLKGTIKKLNDNKYVRMFAEEGDQWISEISRSSDFQFRITEKKIGRELFALYGLSSSNELKAEFISQDTIGLATGSADPLLSTVRYVRVK